MKQLLSLLTAILLSAPVWADDDGLGDRWVHIPHNPSALLRHFGRAPENCYVLSTAAPSSDLTIELLHRFNPTFETLGEKRTSYTIEMFAGDPNDLLWGYGQCRTSGNHIGCGVSGDQGRFRILELGQEEIVLVMGALNDTIEGEDPRYFDLSVHGEAFVLQRMSADACTARLAERGL